jgi:hypothetical protein
MDNGSIKERYGREAYDVWRSLQKQINKIISKIINFNSSYEFEDYLQEAYIACHKAVCNYNFFKESSESYRNNKSSEKFIVINGIRLKMTNMRIDVYAYWYVQKRLYKIADSGEVLFEIYSQDDKYIKTVSNSEYRRSRKKLQGEGCRFNSVNIIKDVELMVEDKKNISGCKDFADASFTGFNPEIQELLKEELFRTQDLNGRMKRLL